MQQEIFDRRSRYIAGLCLTMLILCAGIISMDGSKGSDTFDPRIINAPKDSIVPLDPSYRGFIPEDAVIPTPGGFYGPDGKGGFKKLPNQ